MPDDSSGAQILGALESPLERAAGEGVRQEPSASRVPMSDSSNSSPVPEPSRKSQPTSGRREGVEVSGSGPEATLDPPGEWILETIVSPFHCLYQDALFFHTQSRMAQSEGEASRLARASLMLYLASAEALVRQAASELGRPELKGLLSDPSRPLPLAEAWRLLPSIVAEPGVSTRPFDPESPPWPQFAELLMLHSSWTYPGPAPARRAYYRSERRDGDYEPIEAHQVPPGLRRVIRPESIAFPRTGLPRDPYAFRPHHLDTARGILDAAIQALDRRLGGLLCQGQRHRREPVRLVHSPPQVSES
jgi:hypothetical protein